MVLSISASDALCSGCQVGTRHNDLSNLFDTDGDGVFSPGEGGLFVDADDYCSVPTDYNGYCKFSGAYGYQLFTS
jgi:hypothetical protein